MITLKYFSKISFLKIIFYRAVKKIKMDTGFELLSPRRSFSTTFCGFLTTLTLSTVEEGVFTGDTLLAVTPSRGESGAKKKNSERASQIV